MINPAKRKYSTILITGLVKRKSTAALKASPPSGLSIKRLVVRCDTKNSIKKAPAAAIIYFRLREAILNLLLIIHIEIELKNDWLLFYAFKRMLEFFKMSFDNKQAKKIKQLKSDK